MFNSPTGLIYPCFKELNYYFGTTDLSDIQDTYDVGLLRKVEDENILTRLLKAEGNEDFMYVFEAFGKEVSLKMRKNNLLGKNTFSIPDCHLGIFQSRQEQTSLILILMEHP